MTDIKAIEIIARNTPFDEAREELADAMDIAREAIWERINRRDTEEQGRLVVLDEPRKPIIWGDEAHNSVHCPYCGEDFMGIPYGNQTVVNCIFCGEYIDVPKTVTREAAEAALKEKEKDNG